MRYFSINSIDELHMIDFIPTVCIGFYEKDQENNLSEYCGRIKEYFPDIDTMMCSSQSNIYKTVPHIDDKYKCVFVFFDLKKDAYLFKFFKNKHDVEALNQNTELKNYSAIMLSTLRQDVKWILHTLKKYVGEKHVFGAVAGANTENGENIYYENEFFDDATLVLFLHKDVYEINGTSIHMFEPVGFKMEVTYAVGNTIYEIENRPALEFIENIMGVLSDEGLQSNEYPFFVSSPANGLCDCEALVSLKKIDRIKKTLTFYKHIDSGSKIKIAISIARKEQEKYFESLKEFVPEKSFVFLFVCVLFRTYWAKMEPVYLMHLSKLIGHDLIGFHTFGEIAPYQDEQTSCYQNQTITLVSIMEKGKA